MEFKEYRLFELSKNNKGYYGIGASAVEYDKNLYTYLRITDIKDDGSLNYSNLKSVNDENANKFILENGDIVFARTGNSTGKSYYYDGEILNLVYAGFLIKFSLNEKKVNPKFIKYYTMTNEYKNWVKEIQTGSTRGNINEKMYGNMRIKLPPRYYQDEVVSLLDKIDKKIKINNQINDNLHKLIKNIYSNTFINNAKTDWKKERLGNYLRVERGISYKGKYLAESGTPMINLGNVMPDGVFRLEKNKYYTGKYKEKVTANVGDIVVANTDMTQNREVIGTPVIIPSLYESKVIFSHHIYSLKNLKLPKMYVFYSLLTDEWNGIAGGSATGTTVLALPKNAIEEYLIYIPDNATLEKFETLAENIQKKREKILLEIFKLEQLRDTLLPKLMNGEINLDKIEI